MPLAEQPAAPYLRDVAGSAPLVRGHIPVALINSEGAGSVWILVHLPGAHLLIQALGDFIPPRSFWRSRHT